MHSHLETTFSVYCQLLKLPEPHAQYRFDPIRRWRFDFAWPDHRLAVEIDGGVYTGGRHVRGSGYTRDCEKLNAAVLAGWRVLRFVSHQVKTGEAIETVRLALGLEPDEKFARARLNHAAGPGKRLAL